MNERCRVRPRSVMVSLLKDPDGTYAVLVREPGAVLPRLALVGLRPLQALEEYRKALRSIADE